MQQTLKSRLHLQQYAKAQGVRAAMDCGECNLHSKLEPLDDDERQLLTKASWLMLSLFVLAQCVYGALAYFGV